MVIDCKNSFSFNNAILTLLTNAKCKIGFKNEFSDDYLNFAVSQKNNDDLHESVYLTLPLRSYFDLDIPSPPMKLYCCELNHSNYLSKQKRPVIGIHIGGRKQKSICPLLVNSLIENLATQDLVMLIIYGPDETKKITEIVNADNAIKYQPSSMDDLIMTIQTTDLFVSPDTGPLHIASALNKRIIAVFNTDNSTRYGPKSNKPCVVFNTIRKSNTELYRTVQDFIKNIVSHKTNLDPLLLE